MVLCVFPIKHQKIEKDTINYFNQKTDQKRYTISFNNYILMSNIIS